MTKKGKVFYKGVLFAAPQTRSLVSDAATADYIIKEECVGTVAYPLVTALRVALK